LDRIGDSLLGRAALTNNLARRVFCYLTVGIEVVGFELIPGGFCGL
jgi:hypothetical protein